MIYLVERIKTGQLLLGTRDTSEVGKLYRNADVFKYVVNGKVYFDMKDWDRLKDIDGHELKFIGASSNNEMVFMDGNEVFKVILTRWNDIAVCDLKIITVDDYRIFVDAHYNTELVGKYKGYVILGNEGYIRSDTVYLFKHSIGIDRLMEAIDCKRVDFLRKLDSFPECAWNDWLGREMRQQSNTLIKIEKLLKTRAVIENVLVEWRVVTINIIEAWHMRNNVKPLRRVDLSGVKVSVNYDSVCFLSGGDSMTITDKVEGSSFRFKKDLRFIYKLFCKHPLTNVCMTNAELRQWGRVLRTIPDQNIKMYA